VKSFVGDTPLRLATQVRDAEMVNLLCQAHADPNCSNRSGCAAIHTAASSGDLSLLQLLVYWRADVNLADIRRWRPIHYASAGGFGVVVQWLIESEADPLAMSFHGRTPQQLGVDQASHVLSHQLRNRLPSGKVPERARVLVANRATPAGSPGQVDSLRRGFSIDTDMSPVSHRTTTMGESPLDSALLPIISPIPGTGPPWPTPRGSRAKGSNAIVTPPQKRIGNAGAKLSLMQPSP